MANPIQPIPIDQILKNQTAGLNAANARAIAYSQTIAQIAIRSKVLENAISSPAWRRHAADLDQAANKGERLAIISQNLLYKQAAETGALQKQSAAMTAIGRQRELMEARVRNEAAAHDLASGAYAKHAAAIGGLNRASAVQQKQMAMVHREEELGARYGTAGRFYARNERGINVATGVAAVGAVAVGSMANRGFQGTVEEARAHLAGQLLDREVASIFKPLKDLEYGIKKGAADYLHGLSGNQQNLLMYGGLAVSGLATLGGLAKVASVMHNVSGAAAASASASGVAPLAGAGAIGGASKRLMLAAVPLAVGAVASSQGYTAAGIGAGGAIGAGYGLAKGGLRGGLKGGVVGAGLAAAGAVANTAAESGEDYFKASKAKGHSDFVAGLESAGASIIETAYSAFGRGKEYRQHKLAHDNYTPQSEKDAHRQVLLAQSGFEPADSAYDRIQSQMSTVDTSLSGSKKPGEERTSMEREATGEGRTAAPPGTATPEAASDLKTAAEWLLKASVEMNAFISSPFATGLGTTVFKRPDGS